MLPPAKFQRQEAYLFARVARVSLLGNVPLLPLLTVLLP
jgi:hypothetical protein